MMVQPEPRTQYHMTQRKAARKRAAFLLLALVIVAAFLALVFFFPESTPDDIPALDATATAFAATATAFAETFLATAQPASTLTLSDVEATSTRLFEQLRTAQPLLFPDGQPALGTATFGTPTPEQ